MTEIEKKALALVNEAISADQLRILPQYVDKAVLCEALCRAIEQHEAFRQEVSDAITEYCGGPKYVPSEPLARFIIAKPDPLVEVCREVGLAPYRPDELRAAIEKRGGKIVWGEK